MRIFLRLLIALALSGCATIRPTGRADQSIRESDIRADLEILSSDNMRGREAGTLDELRSAAWIAQRARAAGLEPAGIDGTYFQYFPVRRVRQSSQSTIVVDGRQLVLWREVSQTGIADADLTLPLIWVGDGRESDVANLDLHGKGVALRLTPARNSPASNISRYARRYLVAALNERAAFLRGRGAAAMLIVADSIAESAFDESSANAMRGSSALDTADERRPARVAPALWVRRALLPDIRAAKTLRVRLITESFMAPSVNVVARVRGNDPSRAQEHVLFSAHHDHIGVRNSVNGDSINNGANDNGSSSVALLAIGRAFAARPAARSALFVWHGAEEIGLLGSYWFAGHPTVERASIVAVLNADQIGGRSPDSASLMGVIPPHRSSADLVEIALEANKRVTKFVLDTTWDRSDHPEGVYFRSDHLPYARRSIPALFFSGMLPDFYHTPADELHRVSLPKVTRMARWLYETGYTVANRPQRPRPEPGFKLER